jgi:protein transport protein SEC61 subunit gamma-like protein
MNILEKITNTLRRMYGETRRILVLSRKPKRSEFNEIIKVTGMGIIFMGLLGFAIILISRVLSG